MYQKLIETISNKIDVHSISEERKAILQPLMDFVQQKVNNRQDVNINFICTHIPEEAIYHRFGHR